jgi:hypothetical protein
MIVTPKQQLLGRQINYKTTPLPFGTLYFYGTTGFFNKLTDEYQSQPAPRLVLRTAATVFSLLRNSRSAMRAGMPMPVSTTRIITFFSKFLPPLYQVFEQGHGTVQLGRCLHSKNY